MMFCILLTSNNDATIRKNINKRRKFKYDFSNIIKQFNGKQEEVY